jgi:hypothetical protein
VSGFLERGKCLFCLMASNKILIALDRIINKFKAGAYLASRLALD